MLLRPVFEYARTQGIDVRAVSRDVDLSRDALNDFDRRIPFSAFCHVWTELPALSADPYFGLHVAQQEGALEYDVLGCAFYFSETLGDGLRRLQRFYRVLGDDIASELTVDGPVTRLRFPSKTPRHATECFLATVALGARSLTGDAQPREVRIAHRAPPTASCYGEVFRAPVRFGCAFSDIDFATKDLERPLRTANVRVCAVLDRYMAEILAKLPPETTLLERARFVIGDLLSRGAGRPTIGATARALKLSPRTLQRRLLDHAASHAELVDGVRREMADRMVRERRMSTTEIAFLLGYSDVSGLRRAYHRWTGTTPAHARER